ncbi:STAS domain-containing protein [Rubinisphaera sp.]|uniref:STAS domain-containing protein n=1 Tax=Rubinisphaera sp. TaxID=2024857 RepID=UPI000C0FF204|nr:STAS domain-containing protein [Rubinisphaera sp.]MBV10641.1 hypothetical protein [Rubinisphaera sp.]HCS52314.1 hypothetical protein [Planctomycetaceae bacterium]|tara:strand:- start:696 stop:1031 length:336 start_codon:yes stop_codon:yes gene_type:complete
MIRHTKQGAVDILSVEESMIYLHIDKMQLAVDQLLKAGQPRVVLNMKDVALCDSRGLEFILDLRDRCVKCGGMFKLAAASHLCLDILQITGVLDQIEHYENSVQAAGSFAL